MKMKIVVASLLALGLLAGSLTPAVADEKNDKQSKLEAQAKVTKADAEKTALAKVPGGTVKEAELEQEDGKLVWSFDIATPGSKDITEVLVDAKTGAVVSVEKETPGQQAKEKEEDKKSHHEDKDGK